MKAVACVVLATITGLVVGIVFGAIVAIPTWGLSLFVGPLIGGLAGLLSGILVLFSEGYGRWAGLFVGITIIAAVLTWAWVFGPGGQPLQVYEAFFLVGATCVAGGTGYVAGNESERLARYVFDL